MRRRSLLLLLILFLAVFTVSAQNTALILTNSSVYPFYFAVLPSVVPEAGIVSASPSTVAENAAAGPDYVSPDGIQRFLLENGAYTLIGYFRTPEGESTNLFYRLLTLSTETGPMLVDPAAPSTAGESAPRTPTALPSSWSFPESRIVIDNSYEEWRNVPALAVFSPEYTPEAFFYQEDGGLVTHPIQDSEFFPLGGTRIRVLKAAREDNWLYLFLFCQDTYRPGLSYFLYFHPDRSSGENSYTIEIPVQRNLNAVVLWERDQQRPVFAGNFVQNPFYLEARIDLNLLPPALREADSAVTVDFTSCFHSGASFEEFFFTTVDFSEIPLVSELPTGSPNPGNPGSNNRPYSEDPIYDRDLITLLP